MRTRAKLRVAIAVALHVASSLATAPIPTAQTPYEYQIERFVLYNEYQDGFWLCEHISTNSSTGGACEEEKCMNIGRGLLVSLVLVLGVSTGAAGCPLSPPHMSRHCTPARPLPHQTWQA